MVDSPFLVDNHKTHTGLLFSVVLLDTPGVICSSDIMYAVVMLLRLVEELLYMRLVEELLLLYCGLGFPLTSIPVTV